MTYDINDLGLDLETRDRQLAWLRQNDPVWWDEKNQLWVVTKYEDVRFVLKTADAFSSEPSVLVGLDTPVSIVTMDDPAHAQRRNVVNRGFTPKMLYREEPRMRRFMDEAIDRVCELGTADFVEDLAVPLPLRTIAHLLGFEEALLPQFRHWTDTMFEASSGERHADIEVMTRAVEAFGHFSGHIVEVLESRRRAPKDDMLSALCAAEGSGILSAHDTVMQNDELVMFGVLLVVAGNETTRNSISRGMLELIRRPDVRRRLTSDPSLLPTAIEEILRWTSVIRCFKRNTTRDVELRGKTIKKGDHVIVVHVSANRDEEAFPDPFEFRIDRNPNDHVAFGFGPHFCLGANLARLEMRVAFEHILERLPDLELAPGTEPVAGITPLVHGMAHMPVVFSPTRRRGAAA